MILVSRGQNLFVLKHVVSLGKHIWGVRSSPGDEVKNHISRMAGFMAFQWEVLWVPEG